MKLEIESDDELSYFTDLLAEFDMAITLVNFDPLKKAILEAMNEWKSTVEEFNDLW